MTLQTTLPAAFATQGFLTPLGLREVAGETGHTYSYIARPELGETLDRVKAGDFWSYHLFASFAGQVSNVTVIAADGSFPRIVLKIDGRMKLGASLSGLTGFAVTVAEETDERIRADRLDAGHTLLKYFSAAK